MALSDRPPEGAEELLKEGSGVVGSRRGLRVVLDTEYRHGPVTKPFDGPVVQIDVSDFEIGRTFDRSLISFDRKAVVLGSNENAATLYRLHWVISTAVSVGHFHRRASKGEA